MKILVTCPPMLGMKNHFIPIMESYGWQAICPDFQQTMSEEELIELVPQVDGWIIGDDPCTKKVLQAGAEGRLKAGVRWGIGVDNVDFDAADELGIPITNTPGMFGNEVADLAIGYIIALAREFFPIDRGVRLGGWPKNQGISLVGKTVGVVGYGDIGRQTVKRLKVFGLNIVVWDPGVQELLNEDSSVLLQRWPNSVEHCDFIVFTCSLNETNTHMLNESVLEKTKIGVRIVNIARGPLIDERALFYALDKGKVHSAALDVFETEPLPENSPLRKHPLCIFGSHNGSNTIEAVQKTNAAAMRKLLDFFGN